MTVVRSLSGGWGGSGAWFRRRPRPDRPDRPASVQGRTRHPGEIFSLGTALVTGASSGIGLAFAERLAAAGHDLVLVARDRAGLEALAHRLAAAHGVQVEVLVADLSSPPSRAAIEERLVDPGRPVDLLVNNAGDTIALSITETDLPRLRAHLELNVAAVVALTRAVLPSMVARRRGAVVNVASVNGFVAQAGPAAVYGAGKRFVAAMSMALASELAGSDVHVMTLCPGLTRTEFGKRNLGVADPGPADRRSMSPHEVVDAALTSLAAGRSVCIPGLRFRLAVALGLLIPYRPVSANLRLAREPRDPDLAAGCRRALITGSCDRSLAASAEILAARGIDLVLVGGREAEVTTLADQLTGAHGVEVEVMAVDLADPDARDAVSRRLADADQPVDLLVNGASAKRNGPFVSTDPAALMAHVQTDVMAGLELVRAALPGMCARQRGAIVTVVIGRCRSRDGGSMRAGAAAFAELLTHGLVLSLQGTGVRAAATRSRRGRDAYCDPKPPFAGTRLPAPGLLLALLGPPLAQRIAARTRALLRAVRKP